mmetsp:Transcript_19431/g.32683  ORF Transcript_19431/g.32683 Transcript_19431/m.32683 type:complete len:113 (+) Transcript_19431:108-446(+)
MARQLAHFFSSPDNNRQNLLYQELIAMMAWLHFFSSMRSIILEDSSRIGGNFIQAGLKRNVGPQFLLLHEEYHFARTLSWGVKSDEKSSKTMVQLFKEKSVIETNYMVGNAG